LLFVDGEWREAAGGDAMVVEEFGPRTRA
jgi:hypothetical protein